MKKEDIKKYVVDFCKREFDLDASSFTDEQLDKLSKTIYFGGWMLAYNIKKCVLDFKTELFRVKKQ